MRAECDLRRGTDERDFERPLIVINVADSRGPASKKMGRGRPGCYCLSRGLNFSLRENLYPKKQQNFVLKILHFGGFVFFLEVRGGGKTNF